MIIYYIFLSFVCIFISGQCSTLQCFSRLLRIIIVIIVLGRCITLFHFDPVSLLAVLYLKLVCFTMAFDLMN